MVIPCANLSSPSGRKTLRGSGSFISSSLSYFKYDGLALHLTLGCTVLVSKADSSCPNPTASFGIEETRKWAISVDHNKGQNKPVRLFTHSLHKRILSSCYVSTGGYNCLRQSLSSSTHSPETRRHDWRVNQPTFRRGDGNYILKYGELQGWVDAHHLLGTEQYLRLLGTFSSRFPSTCL